MLKHASSIFDIPKIPKHKFPVWYSWKCAQSRNKCESKSSERRKKSKKRQQQQWKKKKKKTERQQDETRYSIENSIAHNAIHGWVTSRHRGHAVDIDTIEHRLEANEKRNRAHTYSRQPEKRKIKWNRKMLHLIDDLGLARTANRANCVQSVFESTRETRCSNVRWHFTKFFPSHFFVCIHLIRPGLDLVCNVAYAHIFIHSFIRMY